MPIYDYLCSACGVLTEVIHGIDAPPPRFCPSCGREGTLRKAIAAPAVLFKGSGWAKKDRSTASRAGKRAEGREAGGSKESSDGAGSTSGAGESTSSKASPESGASSSSGSSGSSGASGASGGGSRPGSGAGGATSER